MSRGRPNHQASRRRTYSVRQRQVRERHSREEREEHYWPSDSVAAIEIEDGMGAEASPWAIGDRERLPAA